MNEVLKAPPVIDENPIYTVAKCLNELIVNDNLDKALDNIVEWLASSLEIDRCYIFENRFDKSSKTLFTSIRHGQYHALMEKVLQDITGNTTDFPEITSILQSDRSYKVAVTDILSPYMSELLKQPGLKSLLIIPVFSGGTYWGFIGFGDTLNIRSWRNSEPELKSLAAAIGVAIENRRFKNEIEVKNAVYNSTLSTLNEIVWEMNIINKTIKIAGSMLHFGNLQPDYLQVNPIEWVVGNVHPEDKQRVTNSFDELLLKENRATQEEVYRMLNTRSGEYCWVHSRRKLIKNGHGIPVAIVGTTRDVTDNKELAFELEKQKEQYHFLAQSVGQVIFSVNKTGLLTFVSNAWNDMLGYDQRDAVGTSLLKYLADAECRMCEEKFGNLLTGVTDLVDEEVQLRHKNGHIFWVRLLAKNTRDQRGSVSGIFGSIENINSKHNTELLLHESNEKLNTILNSSKEIILTIDLEKNHIENVNEAISILGYKPEEWIGQNYKSWTGERRQKFHELMKLAVKSELQVSNQQIAFSNKTNTEVIPFEFSTSIFTFKNTRYLLCVLRDVRERMQYEQNLKRISNQLTHLINNIEDVYAIYDIKAQRFDFVSNNVETLYECSKEDFISHGMFWVDMIHGEDMVEVEKTISSIIELKGKGEFFYRINTSNGQTKLVLEKVTLGKDKEGLPDKLYIVKTDYTQVRKAEQSLIESEKKFRFISENLSDFISIHDPDWNFAYASPSIKNILGYETEEILGRGAFDLVHPDDLLHTMDEAFEPVVLAKKETRFRYRMRAKDGEYKWVETYSKPVINSTGEVSSIIGSTRDVTDQVDAENRLKASEEVYRLLSENSSDVIAIHNLEGIYTYISPSCKQVFGYEPNEMIGKHPNDIIALDDESRAIAIHNLNEVLTLKEPRKFIRRIITKNGERKFIEVWIQPIIKNDTLIALQAASRDVTEREKLLVELEHSLAKEKELNELRSMFVSTASHQFRTPLTVIQSGVEIMELYLEDLPKEKQKPFQRQFTKIQEEIERLHYLMSDILLLGRANAARTPFNPKSTDLTRFCADIIENKYNNRYAKERRVILSVKGEVEKTDIDQSLMGHAIENIISNAYKYSTEGNLDLEIDFRDTVVQIAISDKGIGIPDEDLKNLFQPFYRATNTEEIEGTGLGLAIVKEFVDKHKGKIFVTSILNKGTTVSVILPIKQNPR